MMPDLFHGDPIPLNRPGDFDIQTWFQGAYQKSDPKIPHTPPIVDPIVDTCLVAMRTAHHCKKIGAVGQVPCSLPRPISSDPALSRPAPPT